MSIRTAAAVSVLSLLIQGCDSTVVADAIDPGEGSQGLENGGVDDATEVQNLSDEEARAWCAWAITEYGATPTETYPPHNAFKEVNGYVYGLFAGFAYPPIVPEAACFHPHPPPT